MKTIGIAFLILVAGCFMKDRGILQIPRILQTSPSPAEPILKGEHELRRMTERTATDSSFGGGFFLFVGGVGGSTSTTTSVKFAWKMNDGTYAISSLPIEKIRVKIDNNIEIPTIKFRWLRSADSDIQSLIDGNIIYAVATVKEGDWPINIKLPLGSS